jgi:hypothetical protein
MRGSENLGWKRETYLVSEGMATDSDWFYPTWDRFGDLLQNNRFSKDSTAKDVADLTFKKSKK